MFSAESSEQQAGVRRSELDASEGDIHLDVLGALLGGFDHLPGTDINRSKKSSGQEGRKDMYVYQLE